MLLVSTKTLTISIEKSMQDDSKYRKINSRLSDIATQQIICSYIALLLTSALRVVSIVSQLFNRRIEKNILEKKKLFTATSYVHLMSVR